MEAGREGGGYINTRAGGRSPFLIPTIQQRVQPIKVKKQPTEKRAVSSIVRTRYIEAHRINFKREYPHAWKDGHYFEPDFPKIHETNGLTTYVANIITWMGGYANRINVSGRMIGGITKTESGALFDDRKMIKSSTKKGTADLMCSISGKMISIEIKNKATRDTMRTDQNKEQKRVEKSGAIYQVVTDAEQFLQWYDNFILSISHQTTIFD